ncbi:MAG TPA: hypothetical protein VNA15_08385 [Candidatus Angelobacter sp.]|nr:hypothetical protein [Candidatus Angelobacter sp.]
MILAKAIEEKKRAVETMLKIGMEGLSRLERNIANAEKLGLSEIAKKLKAEREQVEKEFYGI